MPFGTYDVCVQYTPPSSSTARRINLTGIDNTDPAGVALSADIRTTNTGTCP
jgi:hypothetical protein